MDVNEIQIGGDHYKIPYEHWDMVCDVNLHYLLANATKYVGRCRKKNGIQDLKKALHYLDKAKEREVKAPFPEFFYFRKVAYLRKVFKYTDQLDEQEAEITIAIMKNEFKLAQKLIHNLISQLTDEYIRG